MIRSAERPARDAGEGLHRVAVALGGRGAMTKHDLPAQARRRERPVLGVGAVPGERDRWLARQTKEAAGVSITAVGALFPTEIVIGEEIVGAPWLSVTRRRAMYDPPVV